jgi:isocitrate/isopropylmalate dehydrogenase
MTRRDGVEEGLVDTKTSSGTTLLVLPGDGIGPEIVAATLEVLDAADRQFKLGLAYESADIGFAALAASGTTTPDAVVERAKQAAGVILGPVSHNDYPPVAQGGLNPSGELRRRLDLFANIRPARSRPGLPVRCGRAHPDSR